MTQAQAIAMETLIGLADSSATPMGLWVCVTFAYLTVAVLVGISLSRCSASPFLPRIPSLRRFSVLRSFSTRKRGYYCARERTLLDEIWPAGSFKGWEGAITSISIGRMLHSL